MHISHSRCLTITPRPQYTCGISSIASRSSPRTHTTGRDPRLPPRARLACRSVLTCDVQAVDERLRGSAEHSVYNPCADRCSVQSAVSKLPRCAAVTGICLQWRGPLRTGFTASRHKAFTTFNGYSARPIEWHRILFVLLRHGSSYRTFGGSPQQG